MQQGLWRNAWNVPKSIRECKACGSANLGYQQMLQKLKPYSVTPNKDHQPIVTYWWAYFQAVLLLVPTCLRKLLLFSLVLLKEDQNIPRSRWILAFKPHPDQNLNFLPDASKINPFRLCCLISSKGVGEGNCTVCTRQLWLIKSSLPVSKCLI